jgi:ADP-heptose:LPS heptosyltransferase
MNLSELRATLPIKALHWKHYDTDYKNPPKADHTPVRITGGIGDLILGVGLAEALNRKVGDVVIYSKWPEIVKYFSGLPALPDEACSVKGFDFVVNVNAIIKLQILNGFDGFRNQKMEEVYMAYRKFTSDPQWASIVDVHPYLDNHMAELAVSLGFNRETLPYAFLGLEYKPLKWRQEKDVKDYYSKYSSHSYITVHDGFDTNNKNVKNFRSMKNWGMDAWTILITDFKKKYPEVRVMQLGGPTSRIIPGVDSCNVGKMTFEQSMFCLAGSLCHIDGDSGLVHAAKVFGVPSVVMFGPTNAKFFGYAENRNISSPFCGNCWWLHPDWMANCPVGFSEPRCMDSITPKMVLEAMRGIDAF